MGCLLCCWNHPMINVSFQDGESYSYPSTASKMFFKVHLWAGWIYFPLKKRVANNNEQQYEQQCPQCPHLKKSHRISPAVHAEAFHPSLLLVLSLHWRRLRTDGHTEQCCRGQPGDVWVIGEGHPEWFMGHGHHERTRRKRKPQKDRRVNFSLIFAWIYLYHLPSGYLTVSHGNSTHF